MSKSQNLCPSIKQLKIRPPLTLTEVIIRSRAVGNTGAIKRKSFTSNECLITSHVLDNLLAQYFIFIHFHWLFTSGLLGPVLLSAPGFQPTYRFTLCVAACLVLFLVCWFTVGWAFVSKPISKYSTAAFFSTYLSFRAINFFKVLLRGPTSRILLI